MFRSIVKQNNQTPHAKPSDKISHDLPKNSTPMRDRMSSHSRHCPIIHALITFFDSLCIRL